jgi:hypothetical protein
MDDYIRRQAAIEAVINLSDIFVHNLRLMKYETDVQEAINEVPSADVQPVRHGHWIPKFGGKFKGGAYWYDCSECGHTVAGGILSGNKFCKNCGARMDEGSE